MSDQVEFTSNWKDACALDLSAQQITTFLHPERKCIARLKLAQSPQDKSITLWTDSKACFLVFLTDQTLKEDAVIQIITSVERVMRQEAFSSDRWLASLSVNVFSTKFDLALLSKLRFLALRLQTYEWSISTRDGKETILVREVKYQKVDTNTVSESFANPLSSEELSAFVQLGMDLRKIR